MLGVILVPVLMLLWIRGKIRPETKNPINRFLIAAYQPFVHFVLRFRWLTILAAVLILAATVFPYTQLDKEFMPPLNEGDILYMPTAVPGISINEAVKILQIQDRMLRRFPEVERVFGKAGYADTATDPAPLSMVETVVKLKPTDQWRPGMTWEKLIAELNDIIETAIGGKTIATTVEGRERYPVNVRYARDYREDLDALKRVLVPAPMGGRESVEASERMDASTLSRSDAPTQIPISALADI